MISFIIFTLLFCLFVISISNLSATPPKKTVTNEMEPEKSEQKNVDELMDFFKTQSPTDGQFDKYVQSLPSITSKNELDILPKNLKIEVSLGILNLMKKHWNCEKIDKKFGDDLQEQKNCNKFRDYVHYIYEYFFRVYIRDKYSNLYLPDNVKPEFTKVWNTVGYRNVTFYCVINELHLLSLYYFEQQLTNIEIKWKPVLISEEQLLKVANEEYIRKAQSFENEMKKKPKLLENEKQKSEDEMPEIQKYFDKMLEKISEKATKMAEKQMWRNNEKLLRSPFFKEENPMVAHIYAGDFFVH